MEASDNKKIFPCPCCGLQEGFEDGDFIICEVCGWENDNVQLANPDYKGGANKESLNEARAEFKAKQNK